jgi:hypothetical protein
VTSHNGCAGERRTGYIGCNLRGNWLPKWRVGGSFERLSYCATDAGRLKRSNHFREANKLRLD